jgi:hypothetical protein
VGVELKDELFLDHDFIWRATRRSCQIVFGNIWEMADERLINAGEDWRVVIDFPFDRESRGPQDDRTKVEGVRRRPDVSSRTIVWIPSFFSRRAQDELGTLVKLEHILTGERFGNYVTRLSPQERSDARTLLENQRSQLRLRIIGYLQGAYGIATPEHGSIDPALKLEGREHFESLGPSFDLAVPVGANLREAFEHLLNQSLKFQFPAHPQFDPEAKLNTPMLKRVFSVIEQATQAEDGRVAVDQPARKEMRLVANPLRLGEMAETHFVLGVHWKNHFLKKEAEHQMAMTVGALRRWMDEPQAMGLPTELQNLVILSFAAQTNRSFALHEGPFSPALDNLPDELALREQQLPAQTDWDVAMVRGGAIFGVTASQLLNATNLAKFIADVRKIAESAKADCDRLVERLQRLTASPLFSEMPAQTSSSRLKTARATKDLIDALLRASDGQFVETLARAEIVTTEAAMGTSLKSARDVLTTLEQADGDWQIFEALCAIDDQRQPAVQAILDSLKTAFQSDELAVRLNLAMKDVKGRATRLLIEQPKPQPTPPESAAPPVTPQPATPISIPAAAQDSGKILAGETMADLTEKESEQVWAKILEKLKSDADARLRLTWEVYTR